MNTIIIGSVALLLLIMIVALLIFRPRGNFKPTMSEPAVTTSVDKPLVLRFPGGAPDELGGEPPRDTLHRVGDRLPPGTLPPDIEGQRRPIPLPKSDAGSAPPANGVDHGNKPGAAPERQQNER